MDAIVKMIKVNKYFGKVQIINNLNLSIKEGEKISIVGPSGGGKSTLLRCLNRLERIQSGEIWLKGERIDRSANDVQIRQQIGIVFQNYNLFPHLKLKDNITLALRYVKRISKKKSEQIAYDVLKKVHLEEKWNNYPLELSGGQQQRGAIARTLALNPDIILFDEITSALDPELINEVLDVLRELSKTGKTMVIVTHEAGFAREISDRILLFDEGNIIEEGNPEEFFNRPKTKRAKDFLSKILK
jgi:polar amino acid transport system ATP-binding protein